MGCSVVKNTSGKNTTRKNAESENTIEQNSIEKGNSNKISIVCTTFPQYDWVKNILGEEAERFNVTLLLDNGVDMHSYQPAVKDIATAGSSNLFIYVGGESDTWVEDALKEAKNKDLKAINLLGLLLFFLRRFFMRMSQRFPFFLHSFNNFFLFYRIAQSLHKIYRL